MSHKLIQLSLLLEQSGHQKAAINTLELVKVSFDDESLLWQKAWEAVNKPRPQQLPTKLASQLAEGVSGLIQAGKDIQDANPEQLRNAGRAAKKLMSTAGQSTDTLLKYSKIGKDPKITKEAGIGSAALRSIPLIGVIFSGLLAFKNFHYAMEEAGNLFHRSRSEDLGVSWYTLLIPANLRALKHKHQSDPVKLPVLDDLAKIAKSFVDELISFIANGTDFVKDMIFLFLDIFTAGWAIWLDIGISVAIMAIEWATESAVLERFDSVIEDIYLTILNTYRKILNSSYETMSGQDRLDFLSESELTDPQDPSLV